MIRDLTPGERMVRNIQAQRNWKPEPKLSFPTPVDGTKCDRSCRECGRVFYKSRRQYCPHCETYTVWPITECDGCFRTPCVCLPDDYPSDPE